MPITVYTDPTQQNQTADTFRFVETVLGRVNLEVSGRGPAVIPNVKAVQTESLTFISYLVPSILGMALMQLGIFSAIPLVADREKLILKRLSATPLRRWQLVGSNVLMRLLIAIGPDGDHRGRRGACVRRPDLRQRRSSSPRS